MVAGLTAGVVENGKVWEAPAEIKDRRALLATDEGLFILGSYYDNPETLETFETILSTFKITR
jgi:hypothetical protein